MTNIRNEEDYMEAVGESSVTYKDDALEEKLEELRQRLEEGARAEDELEDIDLTKRPHVILLKAPYSSKLEEPRLVGNEYVPGTVFIFLPYGWEMEDYR